LRVGLPTSKVAHHPPIREKVKVDHPVEPTDVDLMGGGVVLPVAGKDAAFLLGPKILFVCNTCYFDTNNGASIASRSLMECLARRGFAVEALTGTIFEADRGVDPEAFLAAEGLAIEASGRPDAYLIRSRGVRVELHKSPLTRLHLPDDEETRAFLGHFKDALSRFRPDIIVTYGGDPLSLQVRSVARSRGCAVIFALHNFSYADRAAFDDVDSIFVPSRFAAA